GVNGPDPEDLDPSDVADVRVGTRDSSAAGHSDVESETDAGPTAHVGCKTRCTDVDQATIPRAIGRPLEPSNYEWTVKKTEVLAALKQLGFSKDEARALVEQAIGELPRAASREELVRRALRIYRHSE